MKRILWTKHAQKNLEEREIELSEVERTVTVPEFIVPDPPGRQIMMRRYYDKLLRREMLLRVVTIEAEATITVITVYKTSQIRRYVKE
ncbi:MAG: DUF4258 domain-containing protein [Anaerolineales bacterium]|nr:DUF4258 domain-containing protein [Anaerolineales bacterium]